LRVLPRLAGAGLLLETREPGLADPRRAEPALVRRAAVRGVVERRPRSFWSALFFVSTASFWGVPRWIVFFL
jgi:hypothetical protein